MNRFDNKNIKFDVLKERAYNMRWAEVEDEVIPLTAADSDFPVAPEIVQALSDYISEGYFSYTPKLGFPECRESIANALYKRKNEKVDPDLVLPIDSAARGMYIVAQSVLEEGDEVIVFDPVDYLFKQSVLSANAVPVLYPSKIGADGNMDISDIEDYITDKTKMICLCNPHNPFGKLYSMDDLDKLLTITQKHDLYIMNDEIWADIVYSDSKFNSLLELGNDRNKKTLSVFGFSKSFGIAGLRAGCIYCQDKELFDKVVERSDVLTTAGGITSLSQIAVMACMDKSYYWLDEFVEHLQSNRDYALKRIEDMPFIRCHKPDSTFLLFPDIRETGMQAEELAELLLNKYKLAIVPGNDRFFGPGARGHIRICFSTSKEVLKKGLDRLEQALNDIKVENK